MSRRCHACEEFRGDVGALPETLPLCKQCAKAHLMGYRCGEEAAKLADPPVWPPMPAWSETSDGDKPLAEDRQIEAAHPLENNRHDLYREAMRLVGARRSKGGLVELVTWLLLRVETAGKVASVAKMRSETSDEDVREGCLEQARVIAEAYKTGAGSIAAIAALFLDWYKRGKRTREDDYWHGRLDDRRRTPIHDGSPPHHGGCSNPAMCDCECTPCKRIWEAAGRPDTAGNRRP